MWEGKRYGKGQFYSPLKDMREQTVLVENSKENKNDSYRQRTKYDDQMDCYFSTDNLSSLLGNQDSYLEGKLNSADDVDCYAFSYIQRALYDRMGISSKITIHLDNLSEGSDYDLLVYDKDGNQIGIAGKNSDGSRELTLPEWDHNRDYVIRVENRNGEAADGGEPTASGSRRKGHRISRRDSRRFLTGHSRRTRQAMKRKWNDCMRNSTVPCRRKTAIRVMRVWMKC